MRIHLIGRIFGIEEELGLPIDPDNESDNDVPDVSEEDVEMDDDIISDHGDFKGPTNDVVIDQQAYGIEDDPEIEVVRESIVQ